MTDLSMRGVAGAIPADQVHEAAAKAPSKSETDWSGLWFKIVEDNYGEFIGMRGGRRIGEREVAWVFPSHAEHDGLGGFVHVLREAFPDREIRVPERKSRKPSFLKRAGAFLRLLARAPRPAARWNGWHRNWSGAVAGPGREFATQVFDKTTTLRLVAKARKRCVPLNSLLLSTLARASQPDVDDGPLMWMMPVNMRGPVTLARDTANHTGYLQIEIPRGAPPSGVHERVKVALARRDHWATWTFLNLSKYVGYAGIQRIYKFQMARFEDRPFVGSFSNLGAWDGVGEWSVCPLVAKTCPVGVGAIICDGRLSLTVEAHPSIARETGWTKALMDRWIARLDAE